MVPSNILKITFLILSYYLLLSFTSGVSPSYFPTKIFCAMLHLPHVDDGKNQSIKPVYFALTREIFALLVVICQSVKRLYDRKEHRETSVQCWLFSTALGPTQPLKDATSFFLTHTHTQSKLSSYVNKTHLLFPTPRVYFSVFVCVHFYLLNFCSGCCKGGNKVIVKHLWFEVLREVKLSIFPRR